MTAAKSNLTYTWATTGTPPAAVTFSANGTNAAKNTTATFTKAGTYNFQVTIKDQANQTVTSSVPSWSMPTLTSIVVSPASATVSTWATQQFTATARDQFGASVSGAALHLERERRRDHQRKRPVHRRVHGGRPLHGHRADRRPHAARPASP